MKSLTLTCAALGFSMLAGCASSQPSEPPPEVPPAAPSLSEAPPSSEPAAAEPAADTKATAATPTVIEVPIEAKSGSKLTGTVKFSEQADGVQVVIQVANLTPGARATHVHETGDCSAPDAKSAGGHFNPDSHPHALPTKEPRHLGDLGNIDVAKDGTGSLEIVVPGANLKDDDPHSFLGRALIVHEKKDDGGQPTGNAGGRIGCAVIKKS
jgi:superoxide dismutase, Cu-Zn family